MSSENSRISIPKTQKLRTKKDQEIYKETFLKNHSLNDEILKLFNHNNNGKMHQIKDIQNESDFLSFCIQERTTTKVSIESNSQFMGIVENKKYKGINCIPLSKDQKGNRRSSLQKEKEEKRKNSTKVDSNKED